MNEFAYNDKCELCRVSATDVASARVNQCESESGEYNRTRNKGISSSSNDVVERIGERIH